MVIQTFKHRGVERFFTKSDQRGIPAKFAARLERMLDRLDNATHPHDMNLPGYKFHELTGQRKGTYSLSVSGNWRLTFRFHGENAIDVQIEDYH
jgi:proteic killer suppression protein